MTNPAETSAYITGAFTVVAAIVAFGPVAFQIWRQGKLNREAAVEGEKNRFKAELYRDGVGAARALSNAVASFHSYLLSSQIQIEVGSLSAAAGQPFSLPGNRYPEVMKLERECSNAILDLIFLVEERRIFDPKLLIFRDALNSAWHDLRQAMGSEFQWSMMRGLPTELPNGQLHPYQPPQNDDLDKLKQHIASSTDPLSDLGAYAEDFIVELQNVLLGETFGTRVDHRVPLDPNRRVIRLDEYIKLKEWLASTPWGKECSEIEQRTLADLNAKMNEYDE